MSELVKLPAQRQRGLPPGALGVSDFGRPVQVQAVEASGIQNISLVTDLMARLDGLPWHARSVQLRSKT